MKTKKMKSENSNSSSKTSRFFKFLFYSKDISGVTSSRFRTFLNGRIMKIFLRLVKSVSNTSARFFGAAMLTFGISVALVALARYYFEIVPSISIFSLVVAGVFVLLSVPFLITREPVGIAFQKNRVTDFILFEFFALNKMVKSDTVRTLHPLFGIILGLILAVLAYFFPVGAVVLGILGILFFSISMVSPEFPVLISLVFLPYLDLVPYSAQILALVSLVALVSFARKVLIGKRVYSFEVCDLFLVAFAVMIFVSSLVHGDFSSEKNAYILISFIFAYIPLSNIIVNRRLAICAVNAFIVSMLPVAIGAIADYVIGILRGKHAAADFIFGSSEELAVFLLVAFFLSTFFVLERSHASMKALYLITLGIYLGALISTESVFALLVLFLSIPAYIIIRSLGIPRELLCIIALSPCAIFFLPNQFLERLSNIFFAMPDFVAIKADILASFDVFREHIFFGAHLDGEAANIAYGGNSIFFMLSKFGVIATAVLALAILVRLRRHTAFAIYRSSSNVSNFVSMGNISAFAIFTFGTFYNVFSSPGVFYLFFAMLGISAAGLRISKRDHEDRLSYYGDQSRMDSSAIDVVVRY